MTTKPVRLELNNSGAWKLIARFDAANEEQAGRIMVASDKFAFALNAPGMTRCAMRIATDESLPIVLMHWSAETCAWEAHELAIMRRNYAHFPTSKIGALAGMVRKQLKGPKAE